jgi:hypothetical protein
MFGIKGQAVAVTTPIMTVSALGNLQSVELLIKYGAKIDKTALFHVNAVFIKIYTYSSSSFTLDALITSSATLPEIGL